MTKAVIIFIATVPAFAHVVYTAKILSGIGQTGLQPLLDISMPFAHIMQSFRTSTSAIGLTFL